MTTNKKPAYRPRLGDLVEVQWFDTTAFTNTRLSDVKLSRGVNTGVIVKHNRKEIVLRTGNYPDDPPADRLGDFVAIPRAWTDKIKLIKKAKKK